MSYPPVETLLDRTQDLLCSDEFRRNAVGFDRRKLIEMANAIGGPRMRLLHWKILAERERIPRFDESRAVDAAKGIDEFGAPIVEVFMVSHRWLNPSLNPQDSHPDQPTNEKARVLNQFSLWRRDWVKEKHGFEPEIFYWIDFSCIDQDHPAPGAALLPLWVACCERFLRIETPDYDERAWCRIEPLLSHVFSFADHHISIGLDFRHRWPYFGERSTAKLLDPLTGKLTVPEDINLIRPLVELASSIRPAREDVEEVCLGGTEVTCFRL